MVAKAPRKNIAAGRSNGTSPSSGGGSGKKKGKVGGSGNPLKIWPIPKGQKELQSFFGGCSGSSSSDGGGGPSSFANSEELDRLEGGPNGSCEEVEQLMEGESSDSGSSGIENNSSVQLDNDITQLNSDDSDED